jgi:hypothetical protein
MNFLHATPRVASLLVGSDSFSTTSAACVSSEDVTPAAISARLRIEHGAISIPIVSNDPDAIVAPTSRK